MLTAGVKSLEDLTDLFVKHTHTGRDFSPKLNQDFIVSHTLYGTSAATAGNYSTFLNVPYPFEVLGIQESHSVAGTNAGDVTLQVEKLTGTTAPGSGLNLLATPFNLKATANTVYQGSLTTTRSTRNFVAGDRMAIELTGTPTDVANLVVTLWLRRI